MPEPKPALIAKLAEITGLMAHIKKEGFNKAQQYAFVRESDVAEKVSALLAERKIFLSQTVIASSREQLYKTQSGSMMWITHVEMAFQFIDGETGEVSPIVSFHGDGADTGDKGIYKAMTGAEKYFLMKTFLVSTGDDPESDEKVDKAAAAAGAARGPVRVTKGSQEGVERGGKSSLITAAQIREIVTQVTTLELDGESFANIVKKTTGIDPEGKTGKELLAGLSAEQAANIINALTAMSILDADVADEPEGEQDDDPGPVAIV